MSEAAVYSVWSRGRLIGKTDLGYVRWLQKHRMGDFYPSDVGETLMPVATGVSQALADHRRAARNPCGDPKASTRVENRDDFRGTTESADIAAAMTHCESLQLELRRPDGSIVPTEWIHIQDTELLLALAEEAEEEFDFEEPDPILGDPADLQLLKDMEHDAELLDEMMEADAADARAAGIHVPYEWEEQTFPRYQIQIRLLDDRAIP
jgi:hypothetical protein